MQLSTIFVDGGCELGMIRCGLNSTISLSGVVGTAFVLEKYKLVKLKWVPSVHEFGEQKHKREFSYVVF